MLASVARMRFVLRTLNIGLSMDRSLGVGCSAPGMICPARLMLKSVNIPPGVNFRPDLSQNMPYRGGTSNT